jgi:hypothetical protein
MTIRMGYWDCPACNRKRIEGPQATCPQCGIPRGPTIQFYTDDNAPVVEDPELVARARAGADWHCRFCGADNRAGHIDCQQCGAGPDGTKRRQEQFIPQGGAPQQGAPKKKSNALLILLSVFAVLGLGIWFLFFRTTALMVTVESATWVKTLPYEELKNQRSEAWADEVPKGAREISRTTRDRTKEVQDGVEKVKVGKKNLGNGMFEDVFEERPKLVKKKVSEPWVTYEVEKWVDGEPRKTKSTDGKEPPNPTVAEGPKVRVKNGKQELDLDLRGNNGKTYDYTIDMTLHESKAETVRMYRVGQKFKAQVTTAGTVKSLEP